MLNVLIGLCLCAALFVASYYAAHYVVDLRSKRDGLANDMKHAEVMIKELEDRVMLMEAERDMRSARMENNIQPAPTNGWDDMNIRS